MAISTRHLHRKNIRRNQRQHKRATATDDSFREDGMYALVAAAGKLLFFFFLCGGYVQAPQQT